MRINFFYAFMHLLSKFILGSLFRLEEIGVENIPKEGGVIFAVNHASIFDPIFMASASPRQMYFLAKDELFKGFFFPLLIKRLNALPIKREGGGTLIFRKVNKLMKKGNALLLFPEGTRTKNGRIGKGKTGVSLISYATSSPVVPVFIEGSFYALPPGAKMFKPSKVRVKFGKPLYPKGEGNRENYKKFTELIMQKIKELKDMPISNFSP